MKSAQDIINKTISSTNLSKQEQEDLRKELESHFFEAERDLNLKGKSEKEAVEDFGDPVIIGKHIQKAHRKFERIPVLGDLIYYPPFRYGMTLCGLMFVYSLIEMLFIFRGLYYTEILMENINWPWYIMDKLFLIEIAIIPTILAIFTAGKIAKKIKNVVSFFLVYILAALPHASIFVIYFTVTEYDIDNIVFIEYFIFLLYFSFVLILFYFLFLIKNILDKKNKKISIIITTLFIATFLFAVSSYFLIDIKKYNATKKNPAAVLLLEKYPDTTMVFDGAYVNNVMFEVSVDGKWLSLSVPINDYAQPLNLTCKNQDIHFDENDIERIIKIINNEECFE